MNPIGKLFIRISLRTDVPFMASGRAAVVNSHVLRVEHGIMTGGLDAMQARGLLTEGLRVELGRIIAEQRDALMRSDAEIDAAIARLQAENRTQKQRARHGELADEEKWLTRIGERACIPVVSPVDPDLARSANKLRRDISEIEIAALEGDPVDEIAAPVVARFSAADVPQFVEAPMTLSRAIEKTFEIYP